MARTAHAITTRRLLVAAAAVGLLSGCGTIGKAGDHLPEGSLAVSLSEGLHTERSDAPHGRVYSIRITLRNKESAPVSLRGIRLRNSFGDARFVDALAATRQRGDREARVFNSFPPGSKEAELGTLHDLTATTVRANNVVDVVIGVTYGSGDHAGVSGFDVIYTIRGVREVTGVDAELELCQGDMVDGNGCAERVAPMNKPTEDNTADSSTL